MCFLLLFFAACWFSGFPGLALCSVHPPSSLIAFSLVILYTFKPGFPGFSPVSILCNAWPQISLIASNTQFPSLVKSPVSEATLSRFRWFKNPPEFSLPAPAGAQSKREVSGRVVSFPGSFLDVYTAPCKHTAF